VRGRATRGALERGFRPVERPDSDLPPERGRDRGTGGEDAAGDRCGTTTRARGPAGGSTSIRILAACTGGCASDRAGSGKPARRRPAGPEECVRTRATASHDHSRIAAGSAIRAPLSARGAGRRGAGRFSPCPDRGGRSLRCRRLPMKRAAWLLMLAGAAWGCKKSKPEPTPEKGATAVPEHRE